MESTAGRPLVTGEVQPTEELVFAVGIEVLAVLFLAVAVNLLAAGLALAACLFYVFVYTLGLKRTSKQNIVIGGAAGAAPALIGWAAWATVIWFIGTKILPEPQTRSDIGELLRTMGFAASPGLLLVLRLVPLIGGLIALVIWLWQLTAMVVAVRQALDYKSSGRAVLVCFIGWVFYVTVMLGVGLLFGIVGFDLG